MRAIGSCHPRINTARTQGGFSEKWRHTFGALTQFIALDPTVLVAPFALNTPAINS